MISSGTTVGIFCDGAAQQLDCQNIVDGTANVILYGEKRMNVRLLGTLQNDDNEGWTASADQDTYRVTALKPLPDHIGTLGVGRYAVRLVACGDIQRGHVRRLCAGPVL